MRYSAASKFEIIRIIEESVLGIRRTCEQLGISRSTFYNWYDRYLTGGRGGPKNSDSVLSYYL
jgi:transposase-like protein